MSLEEYLQRYLPELDRELRRAVDELSSGPPELDLMLRYHLGWVDEQGEPTDAGSGKRVRPVILLLCAEIAGGDWRQALPAAAAIELVHNFSLIHDDIEDDSPLRRGRPTLWKVWGRASAINAGDAMFALAHLELWRLTEVGVCADRVLEAWRLFERTNLALTRGQHLDMAFERRSNVSVEEYLEMIAAKSAALIAASAQVGAVVGGAPPAESTQYGVFGHSLGMAFQVRDDILGVWGDPDVTGKSAATDIMSRKKSLPILYGLSCSPELAAIFSRPHGGEGELARAVAALDAVGARGFAEGYESRYFQEAFGAFRAFGTGAAGGALSELVALLFGRRF